MERGRVHLTARLTARLLFIAVSGQIDAYGDDIRATLDSGVGNTNYIRLLLSNEMNEVLE